MLVVRERELRRARDGSAILRLVARRPHGHGRRPSLRERARELAAACERGASCASRGRYARAPALRRRRSRCAALRPAQPRRVRPRRRCSTGRRAPVDADGGRPARADRARSSARTCARCWTACSAPTSPTWRALPRRAGRQALPPGLPPRAARALARRRRRPSPSISATFPGIDRDVAVTGALLHDIGKLDAYTADPLAIDMTDLGKLQGEIPLGYYRVRRAIEDLPGFPRRPRGRGPAHHPQPPRPARARLAGRPVHARGDARAHDRQPRRPARLVRPPREGAAATGGRWSGFRPRARRRRLFAARAAGRGPRSASASSVVEQRPQLLGGARGCASA